MAADHGNAARKASRETLRATYALLVSGRFPDDDPEYEKGGAGFRDDQIWLNRLAKQTIRVWVGALDPTTEEWYLRQGFLLGNGFLTLSWDNYRKVCDC